MALNFKPRGEPRYDHQRRALRRIIETRGVCALLMDPGVGKTAVAIDYASALALKVERPVRVLVLAPLAALDSWVGQTSHFAAEGVNVWAEALGGSIAQRAKVLAARGPHRPDPREGERRTLAWAGVDSTGAYRATASLSKRSHWDEMQTGPGLILEVVSLDSLGQRRAVTKTKTTADLVHLAVKKFTPDLIVIDESHRIKGASANVSRTAARLTRLAPRRLILTGTVMPHSPMDVWAQWRFLEPMAFNEPSPHGGLKEMPFGKFEERYGVFGGHMGTQIIGYKNLGEMQGVMARNAIVVRKEDALDLPPVTDVTVHVHLSQREQDAYDSMKQQLAAVLANGALATVPNRLAQMMRLRQITSGYVPDDTGLVHQIGTSKRDTVASIVNDTLIGESRVVVFAHFKRDVTDLAAAVTRPGTEVMVISGDTPPKERERLRKRFGSADPQRIVLVCQQATMSLAVNELVTASHAVFASLSERRDVFVQSRDRLNRIGQTKPVTFWYVAVPGTVDELLIKTHNDRTSLEAAVLQHILKGS